MVQILEDHKAEEEQDESMLPSRVSSNNNKIFTFTKEGFVQKQQDEWN